MKVISAKVRNFASYKELDVNFTDQGLTLIQGPTGSGKSTLCDIIPWILFGKTAKGGAVDEIRSWNTDEPTKGTVYLPTVTIARTRGAKAKDNDLMFWPVGGVVTRGKDIPDTQRLINNLLGMDYELYLAGAYYHEFSQTAQFFTTTAKNRRTITEQLVDLTLPKTLALKLSEELRQIKTLISKIETDLIKADVNLTAATESEERDKARAAVWVERQKARQIELQNKYDSFEADKRQALETYLEAEKAYLEKAKNEPTVCHECGSTLPKSHKHITSPFTHKIDAVLARENNYLEQINDLLAEENPYYPSKTRTSHIKEYTDAIKDLEAAKTAQLQEQNDIELLQDITAAYRASAISNTISDLESNTNKLLTNHFDGEIRVQFEVEDADKLEVTIFKDGNQASYTQLSKGQRCLLKLCFGVSVMRCVANHHGLDFSQIFFDESLDGLDSDMKIKALGLFGTLSLEYEGIYLVEHSSEIKAMVNSSYNVELINGESKIEKSSDN